MTGMTVKGLFGGSPLVHVAILCPPDAAPTLLLNKMSELGGLFTLLTQVPVQVSSLAKSNGQPNIVMYPVFIFAIQKSIWEGHTGRAYIPTDMHQMEEILSPENPNKRLVN